MVWLVALGNTIYVSLQQWKFLSVKSFLHIYFCEKMTQRLIAKKKDIQTNLHEHPIKYDKYVQILWKSLFSTYLSIYLSDPCFRLWSNHTTNDVPDVNPTPLAMHLKPTGCSHLFQLGPGSHPKTAPAPYSPGNISHLEEKMGIIFKRCRLGGDLLVWRVIVLTLLPSQPGPSKSNGLEDDVLVPKEIYDISSFSCSCRQV